MPTEKIETAAATGIDGLFDYAAEVVEREAWLDLFAAAPSALTAASRLVSERLGPAAGLADPAVPIVEMNRVVGLGLKGLLDEAGLDEAISWLERHAAPGWAIQMPEWVESTSVAAWLHTRRLEAVGTGWAKFRLRAHDIAVGGAGTGFDIRAVGTDHAEIFGSTVQTGFGLPAETATWFAALAGRQGWRTYLAFDGTQAVAAAAMFVRAGWAWMGIDATLEAARNKGAQSGLIARRLRDGREAGMLGFTAETAHPAPIHGGGFQSYHNYCRAEFVPTYVRRNYKKAPATG